jgi:hypothetical protein
MLLPGSCSSCSVKTTVTTVMKLRTASLHPPDAAARFSLITLFANYCDNGSETPHCCTTHLMLLPGSRSSRRGVPQQSPSRRGTSAADAAATPCRKFRATHGYIFAAAANRARHDSSAGPTRAADASATPCRKGQITHRYCLCCSSTP